MAKKPTKRKTKRPAVSPAVASARETRALLRRAIGLQRDIRRLGRELEKAVIQGDDALRQIGRLAIERDDAIVQQAVRNGDAPAETAVGAESDPRD